MLEEGPLSQRSRGPGACKPGCPGCVQGSGQPMCPSTEGGARPAGSTWHPTRLWAPGCGCLRWTRYSREGLASRPQCGQGQAQVRARQKQPDEIKFIC